VKRLYPVFGVTLAIVFVAGAIFGFRYARRQYEESRHYERDETELVLSSVSRVTAHLFKAGETLEAATEVMTFSEGRAWLPAGSYFLKVDHETGELYYPVPMTGYRGGPDEDGSFIVTVRGRPRESPPRLRGAPEFVFIPSGHFLFGDRRNPQDPHLVWLTGYFISPFEVSNAEFREFLDDPGGWDDDTNWTEAGRAWKSRNVSRASARLKNGDADLKRFGQPDQPVVDVTWFEANAFCRRMTKKLGGGKWLFALPTEAEWEKGARGPDGFEYGLGMKISDDESHLYNWKKNPSAEVTVVGIDASRSEYQPNRYGLYHATGNVAEWTQSVSRAASKKRPYVDDDRNYDDVAGVRVLRGGSWYSASTATLGLAYRETFQPEVSAPYLGFRKVARPLP